MDNLKEKFNIFAQYCFDHGGALKSHISFGSMWRELNCAIDEQDIEIKRLQTLNKRLEDDAEMLKTLQVMREMEAQ